MTTLGFGDIYAATTAVRLIVALQCLTSHIMFGLMIGIITRGPSAVPRGQLPGVRGSRPLRRRVAHFRGSLRRFPHHSSFRPPYVPPCLRAFVLSAGPPSIIHHSAFITPRPPTPCLMPSCLRHPTPSRAEAPRRRDTATVPTKPRVGTRSPSGASLPQLRRYARELTQRHLHVFAPDRRGAQRVSDDSACRVARAHYASSRSGTRRRGIASQVLPSSSLPPRFLKTPPHCLKKNGTPAA